MVIYHSFIEILREHLLLISLSNRGNNTPIRELFPTLSAKTSPRRIVYVTSEYPQTYYQETIQIPSQWTKRDLVRSIYKNIENINKKLSKRENEYYTQFLQKTKVSI